jgi:PAS domain S-box-containing protein
MIRILKIALMFIILVGTLSVSTIYLVSEIKSKYTDLQEITLKTISETTQLGVNEWKKQVSLEYSLWLNSPVISQFVEEGLSGNIDSWLKSASTIISAEKIYITNLNGAVISRTDNSSSLDISVFRTSRFLTLDGIRINILKKVNKNSGHYLIFTYPLLSFDEEIKGYVHFAMDMKNAFSKIIEGVKFGDSGRIIAIHKDGSVINNIGSKQAFSPPSSIGADSEITFSRRNDELWVGLYDWDEGIGFWVLIQVKYTEMYSIYKFIRNLVSIFSISVCVIVILIFFQFVYFTNRNNRNNLIYKTSFHDSLDVKLVFSLKYEIIDWSGVSDEIFGLSSIKAPTVKNIDCIALRESICSIKSNNDEELFFDVFFKGVPHSGSIKILNDKVNSFILVECKNISKQVEIANIVKIKEERLRTAMQATNQGYFDLNIQAGVEYFDSSLVEMLGYPEKTKVDRGFLDSIIHPDDFKKIIDMNTKIFINDSNKLVSAEVRMRTYANRYRYVLIKTKVVSRNDDGVATRMVGVHLDITMRKKSELLLSKEKKSVLLLNDKLQKSAKIKDEFIATMSHELRTPLNSIISFSDLLLDGEQGFTEKQANYLGIIQRSGQHLLGIINDILDISKINSGKMELTLDTVKIDNAIKDAIDMVSTLALDKEIKIEYSNAMTVDKVVLDKKKFRQILLNLLSNAIKFTSKGKSIGINCSNTNSKFSIEIWDEGLGISEENIQKLFKPFVQVNSVLTRSQEGTGLGLSLVKKMMDLQLGTVSIESKVGSGSTFKLVFPMTISGNKNTVDSKEGGGSVFM